MAIHPGARTTSQPASPLERLVQEKGLHRFGLFFVAGEDDLLPNGEEATSGYVINEDGTIHSFWTGWDTDRHEVVFAEWETVDEEPEWRGVGEYERARARAGLEPSSAVAPPSLTIPVGEGTFTLRQHGIQRRVYGTYRDENDITRLISPETIEEAVRAVATAIQWFVRRVQDVDVKLRARRRRH